MTERMTPSEAIKDSLFTKDMFELAGDRVLTADPMAARKVIRIGAQLEDLARGDFVIPGGVRATYPTMCAFYSGGRIVEISVDTGPKIGGRSESSLTVYELPEGGQTGNLWEDMSESQKRVAVEYNPHVPRSESYPGYRLQAIGYEDEDALSATLDALDELASVAAHPPYSSDSSDQ